MTNGKTIEVNKGIANKINMLAEGKDTEETDGSGLKSMILVFRFLSCTCNEIPPLPPPPLQTNLRQVKSKKPC